MIKAAFVTGSYKTSLSNNLPEGQSCCDGVEFFVPPDEADVIFVYNDFPLGTPRINLNRHIPKVLITADPPDPAVLSYHYPRPFLSQFDYVLTHTHAIPHPNLILGQTVLPWLVGSGARRGENYIDHYDEPLLLSLSFNDFETHAPQKTKLVSVVTSKETSLPGHRARLEFVAKLKEALGDQVDVFGRGINGFADKRDVLDDYRYHIAIENSVAENYWTEKLADPYLTLTFPIYHGCPNVADYFHHDAIRTINIYEPDQAIETIKDIIASDLAEKNREALIEARRQVLYDYNIFAVMARTAKDILAQNRPVVEVKELRSQEHFMPPLPLHMKVKTRVHDALFKKRPRLFRFYRFLKHKILLRKPLPTAEEDRMAQIVEYLRRKSG